MTKLLTASESARQAIPPLGVDVFKVVDQQQADVPTRRHARPSHNGRIEWLTRLPQTGRNPRLEIAFSLEYKGRPRETGSAVVGTHIGVCSPVRLPMATAAVYAVNHYGRYCFLRLSPRLLR
jgi:hypothetical protein